MNKWNREIAQVADYYTEKLLEHGATPQGVDWNGEDSQYIRFHQLSKILPSDIKQTFSVADLGCGYAALHDFLAEQNYNFSYTGYEVSEQMLSSAAENIGGQANANLRSGYELDQHCDYAVASGILNVRLDTSEPAWYDYIVTVLENMNEYSSKGFAFNCLTAFSDTDKMQNHLYYADPGKLFNLCKQKFSRNVALLHDYDLYEFTILVRKK